MINDRVADLQHRRLVNRPPLRKAREIQKSSVDQIGLPGKNQVAQNFPGSGCVHYTMPTETIREEEAGDFWRLAENGMMIRRHFIEAGPGAFGIDRNIFEDGHAIRGAGQYLLNKARFEISLVARRFFWIIPRQQESAALGTKMETRRHVDDHGRRVRKLVKRFSRNQHAAQRFDGKIDADHFRNRTSPGSGTVDDRPCGDRVARGRDFEAPVVDVAGDSRHPGVLPQRGAMAARPSHESDHGAVRIDEAVSSAEAPADDVIASELREQATNFVTRHKAHVLQSHVDLFFVISPQVGQVLFIGRAKKIALRTVIAWIAKAIVETGIERDRVKRHPDIDRRRKLRPHAAHALARGSLALRGLSFDHKHVLTAGSDKMISNAGADDSSTDENDVCGVHVWVKSLVAVLMFAQVTRFRKSARQDQP